MKNALQTTLVITLLIMATFGVAYIAKADDGDIAQTEVRPDVERWALDSVHLYAVSKQGRIVYRKVDADGNPIGEEVNVLFLNTPAETEEQCDENGENCEEVEVTPASNKFTQLINYIQTRITAGDTLKTAVQKAVVIELGL